MQVINDIIKILTFDIIKILQRNPNLNPENGNNSEGIKIDLFFLLLINHL